MSRPGPCPRCIVSNLVSLDNELFRGSGWLRTVCGYLRRHRFRFPYVTLRLARAGLSQTRMTNEPAIRCMKRIEMVRPPFFKYLASHVSSLEVCLHYDQAPDFPGLVTFSPLEQHCDQLKVVKSFSDVTPLRSPLPGSGSSSFSLSRGNAGRRDSGYLRNTLYMISTAFFLM